MGRIHHYHPDLHRLQIAAQVEPVMTGRLEADDNPCQSILCLDSVNPCLQVFESRLIV